MSRAKLLVTLLITVAVALATALALMGKKECTPLPVVREEPEANPAPTAKQPVESVGALLVEAGYTPPATVDPRLAKFVDRRFLFEQRLTPELVSVSFKAVQEQDRVAIAQVLKDARDLHAIRNEAVNLLRRSNHEALSGELLAILERPGEPERFRFMVIQQLGEQARTAKEKEREVIVQALRGVMGDSGTRLRRDALGVLLRLDDPQAVEVALAALKEDSGEHAGLRAAAIRGLGSRRLQEVLPAIRQCAKTPDESVRAAALVALGQLKDESSRALLEEAAASESVALRRAGELGLRALNLEKLAKP